ncbi:MAG: MFS transporter [Chitinophagales bacterium]
MKYLTRNIWILSLVSLFNDISSEMLYPIMPLFLASIGFSSLFIGLLEGFAEATAGLSKGYFGRLSDASGKRIPYISFGYLLSAISKAMLAVFTFAAWIFTARSMDKLGKGIRTASRDALLSDEATAENKGKVFGFHRAMDTLGAAIGPALALLYLFYFPEKYKTLFLLTFVPGMVAVGLTFLIKQKSAPAPKEKPSFRLSQMFDYLQTCSADYRKLITLLLVFALFNSSDLFLLLKIKASLQDDKYVIACYILFNLVYALASFPLGHLADKVGLKNTLLFGLVIFAVVYAGFGFSNSLYLFITLYCVYGLYMAATEGVAKALVSNIVPKSETASAIGTFAGLSSIAALFASSFAGLLWTYISPLSMFLFSAVGTIGVAVLLYTFRLNEKPADETTDR